MVKCPYCDFNSHVRKGVDEHAWSKALLKELRWLREDMGDERLLETIYFGGGTPSLMPSKLVGDLITEAKNLWQVSSGLEVTLEANPGTYDSSRFAAYASSGVTRLSLGVQSLRDDRLQHLGRIHGAREAKEALRLCGSLFERVSFDLIYGLATDSLSGWEEELEEALALGDEVGADHCSLYQLVFEKGTLFYSKHQQGLMAMLDGDMQSEFFERTNEVAYRHNMRGYEVSNYARGGDVRCYSGHNLRTWRYEDYLGVGPGAHSRVRVSGSMYERRNLRLPERWLSSVEAKGSGIEESIKLAQGVCIEESLMMGLRLYEGVSKSRFEEQFGLTLREVLDDGVVEILKSGGDLEEGDDYIRASEQGIKRLDSVVLRLVSGLSL